MKSEHDIHSQCLPVSAQIQPQLIMNPGYHHLPTAYRKHWWLEPSFVSLNPSAELGTSIDSCSREYKEQLSNQVSVTNNENKKKKKWKCEY